MSGGVDIEGTRFIPRDDLNPNQESEVVISDTTAGFLCVRKSEM